MLHFKDLMDLNKGQTPDAIFLKVLNTKLPENEILNSNYNKDNVRSSCVSMQRCTYRNILGVFPPVKYVRFIRLMESCLPEAIFFSLIITLICK